MTTSHNDAEEVYFPKRGPTSNTGVILGLLCLVHVPSSWTHTACGILSARFPSTKSFSVFILFYYFLFSFISFFFLFIFIFLILHFAEPGFSGFIHQT
ncbi:hypothetical protein ASPTUDRAFT_316872 [Aspergillus tubingensis CBS 134.48]|uniref:Uncharacterized protein n=1 Tax=Aspergillus tubingensis (strain CBS 134.48) TaxID=767770 RepID=A0A1L9NJB6_ASPTC|nr:hypothetical protein ASPTUDRAFT_316872 [Aspergillus tubingensis CBS 134.48]